MKRPDPEVFARTVLSELSRFRAEVLVTRLRLYQHMTWMRWPESFEKMGDDDKAKIAEFYQKSLSQSLVQCGLVPDPKPPHKPPSGASPEDDLYG